MISGVKYQCSLTGVDLKTPLKLHLILNLHITYSVRKMNSNQAPVSMVVIHLKLFSLVIALSYI